MKLPLANLLQRRVPHMGLSLDRHCLISAVPAGTASAGEVSLSRIVAVPFTREFGSASQSEQRRLSLVDALKRSSGALGSDRPNAILSLRQLEVKTRFARLPASDRSEVEQMANFEISKSIPFDDRPYEKRFTVLKHNDIEGADVMMYAVDAEVLDDYVRSLHRQRVPLDRVVAEGLGIWKVAERHAPKFDAGDPATAALADESAPRLIAYLGVDGLVLMMVRDGIPIFMRSAPSTALPRLQSKLLLGSIPFNLHDIGLIDLEEPLPSLAAIADRNKDQNINEVEVDPETVTGIWTGLPDQAVRDWLQRVVRELRRTLEFARVEANATEVRRIDLLGPGALVQGLAEKLAAEMRIAVVPLVDDIDAALSPAKLDLVSIPEDTGDGTETKPTAAPFHEYAPGDHDPAARFYRACAVPAYGAILYAAENDERDDDLTAGWYNRELDASSRRRSMTATGILVAIVVLEAIAFLTVRAGRMNEYMEEIEADSSRMRPLAVQVESKAEKLDIVRRVVADKYSALAVIDLLSALDGIARDRVALRFVDYERGGEVVINGHAKTIGDVIELEQALKAQRGFFSSVILRGQEPTQLNGTDIYEFSFQCNLREAISRQGSGGSGGSGITTFRVARP